MVNSLIFGSSGVSSHGEEDRGGRVLPEQFIQDCFLPAKVTTLEGEGEERVAKVTVRDEDKGIAIGKEGKNIFKAKRLAQRQHSIADVRLM